MNDRDVDEYWIYRGLRSFRHLGQWILVAFLFRYVLQDINVLKSLLLFFVFDRGQSTRYDHLKNIGAKEIRIKINI